MKGSGRIETKYVKGESNLADLLTKCFPTYKFKRLMHQYDAAARGQDDYIAAFMAYMVRTYDEEQKVD